MDIYEFQKKIGYFFKDSNLLQTAFTHSSFASENNVKSYERLEFLGDAIVDFLVGEILFSNYPDLHEGTMTRLRALLVCEEMLSKLALQIGINEYMRLGNGAEMEGARKRPSILADMFEAHIAAMYLDAGLDNTRDYLISLYADKINDAVVKGNTLDYKTQLQEKLQKNGSCKIEYEVVSSVGPIHDCIFEVEVKANGKVLGKGSGNSKKKAQLEAAKAALDNLKK